MRDLRDLYVRANSCVACHERIDADLLQAGHPELAFELDNQTKAEPPHWNESEAGSELPTWLTGQAVALREQSWGMEKIAARDSFPRWRALAWLLEKVTAKLANVPKVPPPVANPTERDFATMQGACDALAKVASHRSWKRGAVMALLETLADSQAGFLQEGEAHGDFHRAQVVAGALQALTAEIATTAGASIEAQAQWKTAQTAVLALGRDVKSPSDFDSDAFAKHLSEFHAKLPQH
jgi:hypothetical protein